MSALKEHMGLLGQFLKTDFRKILLGCTLAMVVAILLGYVLGSFSPETIDTVLEQFAAMVEDAGIMDTEGNISPFGLLTNNWTAMLLAALYGFVPFLYLPVLSLISNGLLIGLLAAWYHNSGLSMVLYLAGILPHGIFELPALLISAACGVCLCRNMSRLVTSSPKRVPMVELLSDLLRVMLLVVLPMTVAAAFIEAYVTPLVMSLFMG